MDEGCKVWAPHPNDSFTVGQILDIGHDGQITIESIDPERKKIVCNLNNIYPYDEVEAKKDVDDNCALMFLNEPYLLNNIRLRYLKNKIYTYVANILIAVNPYYNITNLYSSEIIKSYNGKSIGSQSPHVFAIADKCYRDMKVEGISQSIIVSGESGAGKTESTKYIIKYLTESWGSHVGSIEQKIVKSNPLLEAFGNAKTVRNNNSSRFGKFVEIHFNLKSLICGAHISHYLLEKSRICTQNPEERNYHVFYRLCAGAPPCLKTEFNLQTPDKFNYLSKGCLKYFSTDCKSGMGTINDSYLNDEKDFLMMDSALEQMGLPEDSRRNVYSVVAAVLHLGNIEFDNSHDCKDGSIIRSSSESALEILSKLLGCKIELLRTSLLSKVIFTGSSCSADNHIQVNFKAKDAYNARDAFAKSIYSNLFDYLVRQINDLLPFEASASYIGVLDIAGFEYFQHNSFEQFCINYCNEKLQQFFNSRILKEEQVLYKKEGLVFKEINYMDNQDCIELFENKNTGIFDLLDEESRLPKPAYSHFTMEVHKVNKDHFRLDIPRKSKLKLHRELKDDEGFLIKHYAGAVCYQTDEFIDKNNDALHSSLSDLLSTSYKEFIQILGTQFQPPVPMRKQSYVLLPTSASFTGRLNFFSVGNKFRSQLLTLIDKLKNTGTNFVRCIRPNVRMVDHLFEGSHVMSQLQCLGMVSVLELMQQGYPARTSFQDLYNTYKKFMPPDLARLDPRFFTKALFKALGLNEFDFAFGLTKVFFRSGKFAEFDQLMKSDPDNLSYLLAKVRSWLISARWRKAQWSVLSVIKLMMKISFRQKSFKFIQAAVKCWHVKRIYAPRIKLMVEIIGYGNQMTDLQKCISNVKTDRDVILSKLEICLQLIQKVLPNIRTPEALSNKDLKATCNVLSNKINELVDIVKASVDKDRIKEEEIKIKLMQEEMERQQRLKLEEEARQKELEQQRLRKAEIELKRQEELKKINEDELKSKKEDLVEKQKQEIRKQQENQDRMDRELALRTAGDDQRLVEEVPILHAAETQNYSKNDKFNLSKWTYTELRDTINSSCDITLLNACRDEFYNRIKVYHEWKIRTSKTKNTMDLFCTVKTKRGSVQYDADASEENCQRYFRIPTKTDKCSGTFYAHFDGNYIARQLEVYDNVTQVLLIAGVDDLKMCRMGLEETKLTRRKGAEILEEEFEEEWMKNGGEEYLRKNFKKISSSYLRKKLQRY